MTRLEVMQFQLYAQTGAIGSRVVVQRRPIIS
jgi:hypothetical protein